MGMTKTIEIDGKQVPIIHLRLLIYFAAKTLFCLHPPRCNSIIPWGSFYSIGIISELQECSLISWSLKLESVYFSIIKFVSVAIIVQCSLNDISHLSKSTLPVAHLWFILRHIKFFKFFLKIKSHNNLQNTELLKSTSRNLSPSTYCISQNNNYHNIS